MIKYEFVIENIDKLRSNPLKNRFDISRESLLSLADSIRQYGMFTPILVSKTDAGLQIIAGERRWRAAKLAGLDKVPTMQVEAAYIDILLLFIEENTKRDGINLLEYASVINKLIANGGMTKSVICKKLHISDDFYDDLLAAGDLPSKVKDAYLEGRISAEELVGITKENNPLIAIHKSKSR